MPSAAGIIIGNEILSGKFADENGPYLIAQLRSVGVDLLRLAVVPDDLDAIATEVRACSDRFDLVFTSGGVGPTHDDITLEAVARGFDLALEQRAELVDLMTRFGMELNDAALRMATVPAGARLISSGAYGFPVLLVRNVYVLPGVPRLFRSKLDAIASELGGNTVHSARVVTREAETAIAGRLGAIQERFEHVAIGSYPRHDDGAFYVIVTAESRQADAVAAVRAELVAALDTIDHPEAS